MKGTNPTAAQKRYWSQLAELGCIACRKDGVHNTHVSIHHIEGRVKSDAHWLVLPLCGPHHQHRDDSGVIGVHPYKSTFQARYGKQLDLAKECAAMVDNPPDGLLSALDLL